MWWPTMFFNSEWICHLIYQITFSDIMTNTSNNQHTCNTHTHTHTHILTTNIKTLTQYLYHFHKIKLLLMALFCCFCIVLHFVCSPPSPFDIFYVGYSIWSTLAFRCNHNSFIIEWYVYPVRIWDECEIGIFGGYNWLFLSAITLNWASLILSWYL